MRSLNGITDLIKEEIMRKRAFMVVMNALHMDARVQRAANALAKEYDLTVVGINHSCDGKDFAQLVIRDETNNGILRYIKYQQEVKKVLRKEKIDLFYAHDYFSARLVAWIKKKQPKVKVVYDSHELIIPEKGKPINKRNYFFYIGEKSAIKNADMVICASEARSIIMSKHYQMDKPPLPIENISELPYVSDEFTVSLEQKYNSFFEKKGLTLVYAGVLYAGRKIDELIKVVKNTPNSKLLIIGDGPDMDNLKRIANENIPERVCFTGSIPYNYLAVLLKKCDIGYISYATDTLNNLYCAPNKIYEYASVELPMIANENPTIEKFFKCYGIGCINQDLESSFRTVSDNIDLYKKKCNEFTIKKTWKEQAEKLLVEVNKLFY